MKLIKDLEKKGWKILVNNIIDSKHLDSFWYDGLVLSFEFKGKTYRVEAVGEIRIYNKAGELVYDCKERNSGIKGGLNTDKDLKKIGNNYDDKYYWENNNWMELIDENNSPDDLGDVFYTLDELKGFQIE